MIAAARSSRRKAHATLWRRNMKGGRSGRAALLVLAAALFFVHAEPALAQTSLQPVQSVLQTLINVLTGPIASMVAILAVISCGFLAWTGRFTWGVAGAVIMGIVLVFGSTQIVAFFQRALGQ